MSKLTAWTCSGRDVLASGKLVGPREVIGILLENYGAGDGCYDDGMALFERADAFLADLAKAGFEVRRTD